MWAFVAKRIVQIPLVLLIVTITIFTIIRSTPGDPVQIMLGMQTSPEAAEAMRKEFRLDRPLYEQYGLWLVDLAKGDLGRSIRLNQPVTGLSQEEHDAAYRVRRQIERSPKIPAR